MNKKIVLALSLVASLFLASCEKDLDIKSEASLSATAPLATEDVDKLLTGLYEKTMQPSGYSYFNIMATEIMSDNFKPVKFQWYQVQYMYQHTTPPDDILLSYMYKDYYTAINRANTILDVSTASKGQRGRARYCRAVAYIRLYDLYERVPLVDENYKGEPIATATKEAVINFIIEDLKYAKANCPAINAANLPTSQLTPTSEAATALLARVYRLNNEIGKAGIEAEELINSHIFTLAANPAEYTSEVIMKFNGFKAEENGSWGWIMSPQAASWNCFACADDLTSLVKGDDTRKVLFDFAGQVDNSGYIYSTKYTTDDGSDLIMSRIAEMYLISAEAGNTARLTELQTVRKSSLTLAEERRLEMSFEWTRWEDLKLAGETYCMPYPQGATDANPLLKK